MGVLYWIGRGLLIYEGVFLFVVFVEDVLVYVLVGVFGGVGLGGWFGGLVDILEDKVR